MAKHSLVDQRSIGKHSLLQRFVFIHAINDGMQRCGHFEAALFGRAWIAPSSTSSIVAKRRVQCAH